MIRWSPSTGSFYPDTLRYEAVPDDVVEISEERHAELIAGRAVGRTVSMGTRGMPILGPVPRVTIEQRRTRAARAIRGEAGRRILAVASLVQQSNDNALMAMVSLGAAIDPAARQAAAPAIARRRRIDAIRAASNALEARIANWAAAALDRFDASDAQWWPSDDEDAR